MSESQHKCPPPGAPLWLATFADLMSLLMCFFVLILSFSNMNVVKYKKALGSLDEAFGVQRLSNQAQEIPKGTSIIADHFAPGKPEPTVLDEIRQQTTDDTRQTLEFHDTDALQTKRNAHEIAELMVDELKEGKVDIEYNPHKVVIRLNDKALFESGAQYIRPEVMSLLEKVKMSLAHMQGAITVSGHTDDLPVGGNRFRSNWELSTARAQEVASILFGHGALTKERFTIAGHADTVPLVPNTNAENRSRNRRVEIVIETPKAEDETQPVITVGKAKPTLLQQKLNALSKLKGKLHGQGT